MSGDLKAIYAELKGYYPRTAPNQLHKVGLGTTGIVISDLSGYDARTRQQSWASKKSILL
jgi:hypothetical protein